MSLGIPLNLCFCLLICLVYGSLVDEKPGKETLVPHNKDEVHHHLMKRMTHCNDSIQISNTCPPEWKRFSGSCYRYIQDHKSFKEAENMCLSYGGNGHLASIHQCKVEEFLAGIIPSTENGNVWIGLQNGNKNSQPWQWTDGSHVDYFAWNSVPTSSQDKDVFVQLSKSSNFLKWVFADDNNSSGFICKKDFWF